MTALARARLQACLAAVAIIVVVIAATMFACGCAAREAWGDEITPRYGIEVNSSVPVDLDALDAAWAAVVSCWAARGVTVTMRPPLVGVRTNVTERGRCDTFWAAIDGQRLEVYGITYSPRLVHLAPDCCAARHEMAHAAAWGMYGYDGTGDVLAECDGSKSGGGW